MQISFTIVRLDKLGKYLTARGISGGKRCDEASFPWITGINHRSEHETKKSSLRGIQQGSARSLTGKWIHSHSFGFLKTSPISNRRRVSLSRLSLPAAAACVGV